MAEFCGGPTLIPLRRSDAVTYAVLLAYKTVVAYPRSTFDVLASWFAFWRRHRDDLDFHRARTRPAQRTHLNEIVLGSARPCVAVLTAGSCLSNRRPT